MAVDARKHLQMFLFSHKTWLCLTSSRCRHLGLVERNQGVTKSQLVLYIYFLHLKVPKVGHGWHPRQVAEVSTLTVDVHHIVIHHLHIEDIGGEQAVR